VPGGAAREDIVGLLTAEGLPVTPELASTLRARRAELREPWRKVLPLRVASWERAGWYEGLSADAPGEVAAALARGQAVAEPATPGVAHAA
jgi:hypothetical protein